MKAFISAFILSQPIKFVILTLKTIANQLYGCRSCEIKFETNFVLFFYSYLKLLIDFMSEDAM